MISKYVQRIMALPWIARDSSVGTDDEGNGRELFDICPYESHSLKVHQRKCIPLAEAIAKDHNGHLA